MTSLNAGFWLEVGKLAVNAATPILVALFGVLLLRRIEDVKALVAKRSEFQRMWAEEFFSCCQAFMQALERDLALLTVLGGLQDQNGKVSTDLREEVWRLHPTLTELELRIRRSVLFAPSSGAVVTKAASECLTLTDKLFATKESNVDIIIAKMNDFNVASRSAHGEMLGLDGP